MVGAVGAGKPTLADRSVPVLLLETLLASSSLTSSKDRSDTDEEALRGLVGRLLGSVIRQVGCKTPGSCYGESKTRRAEVVPWCIENCFETRAQISSGRKLELAWFGPQGACMRVNQTSEDQVPGNEMELSHCWREA